MNKIKFTIASLLLCICFAVSTTCLAAAPTKSEIYSDTIFQPNYYSASLGEAILADMASDYIEDVLDEIDSVVHQQTIENSPLYTTPYQILNDYLQSVTMPDLLYWCGKVKLTWIDQDNRHQYERATVELYSNTNYKININNLKWVDVGSGYFYPINCLVYTVYHHDGTSSKYFVPRRSDSATMYSFVTTLNDNNDYISINSTGWSSTAYHLYDQKQFTAVSNFERMQYENRLYWNSTNDIDFPLDNSNLPLQIKWGTSDGFPSDLGFINGSVSWTRPGESYVNTTILQWYTSYVFTNSTALNQNFTNSLTQPYQKNWYYDDTFVSNTTIDNSNVSNTYDGCFASVFNVDLSDIDINALIPSIIGELKPTLDLGIAGLLDALMDFFGDMPDIGLTWDNTTSNDYFEIIYNEDDSGGGGSGGGCNWETPYYAPVNTSVYIPAVVPSYSTYAAVTAPANVLANSKNVLQNGWTFLDVLGLLPLIIPLTIVGILWRFTGE